MSSEITITEKICASVVAGGVLVFAAYSQFLLSDFEELFSDLGSELPVETKIVLATYRWWLLLPGAALVGVYLVARRRNRMGWWPILGAGLLVLVLLPVMVWSMYAPVIEY